jgi:DNA (cytosine-5)-methyltransferase 1
MKSLKYIDLFAGAGGLSEGFIRQNFTPVAHVELDVAACFTLKTRIAYHYLHEHGKDDLYVSYLKGEIKREQLYKEIPKHLLDSVINAEIGKDNEQIFDIIDHHSGKDGIDLIIGGPPARHTLL